MRILIIHPIFSSEGARGSEIIAQDTYMLLKKSGHEVFFFATDKKPYFEDAEWTKYFPEYTQRFSTKWWWNEAARENLAKMLDEIKPDIIHIHVVGQLSYSIFKPILKRKIPIVMTVHDVGLLCPVALGWDSDLCKICKLCKGLNTVSCVLKNCVQTKKRLSSLVMAIWSFINKISGYHRKIDKFITPSQTLADYITYRDVPQNKIKVVPNFLNKKFMEQVLFSDKQDYFLYVGSLVERKGVNLLLEAIKGLPKEIPFKIIGSGPDEDKYKAFVKENGLDNVEILGNIDRKEMIRFYNKCIALVASSIVYESFGMVAVEAHACKRPVIASSIGGFSEILENGINGLLFEPGRIGQLKECISKYWNDKNLALRHGENGYSKVMEKYTEEKYLQELDVVYQSLITRRVNGI